MAFLLRLKRIHTLTNPSLSLLHHRQRHLSSTSNSASTACNNTNPNLPSPSLLRELSEVVKNLHATVQLYVTGPAGTVPSLNFNSNSASSTLSFVPPSFNSSSDEDSDQTSTTLNEKLEKLKAKALTLKQRHETDSKRISELIEATNQPAHEIIQCYLQAEERRRRLNAPKPPAPEIDNLIVKLTRQKEMKMEIVEVSKELTNSRLASFYEIVHDMSQMRKDLPNNDEELGKIWNELRDGLMRGVRLEVIQFEVLAKEMDKELECIQHSINNYFFVRDKCTCAYGRFCGGHRLYIPNR